MPTRRILLFVFLTLVILYALFQARFLILGPRLHISAPQNDAELSSGIVEVTGTAENITSISLDGRPILVDTSGKFDEELLLPAGPSIIEMRAADRFGRTTVTDLRVVVEP